MFPNSRIKRHNLAVYLTDKHTPAIDVTTLIESCATGWKLTCTNGMVEITGVAMFEARIAFGETPQPLAGIEVRASALVQFALHCAWVAFYPMIPSMACYIQSKHMQHATPFWGELHRATAWLISTPTTITDLFSIGRPDLSDMARRMYMSWLLMARCPTNVEAGLRVLASKPWDFTTGTKPFNSLLGWMDRCAVQAIKATPKVPPTGVLIKINNCNAVIIADRDHTLISMLFLFSVETQWSVAGVPEDAPAAFHSLKAAHPYLFGKTDVQPQSPIEDLLYLPRDYKEHLLCD
jgi:hypothetical protein